MIKKTAFYSNLEPYLKCKDYTVSGENYELMFNKDYEMLVTIPVPENLSSYYKSEDYISHTDSKKTVIDKIYQTVKNITLKRSNLNKQEFYQKIIIESKKELTNLVKSQNLIDIRVPSFLNASLLIDEKNNLVELKSRLNQIDLVENLYIKEFNKDSVSLKIKYLGKLENIINQLKEKKVILKLINEEWSIKII